MKIISDEDIIELFFKRSEEAIAAVKDKYQRLLMKVALNILGNLPESEECVSDTYIKLWNVIPPQRPAQFSAFACRITRNNAINIYKLNKAQKRGSGQIAAVLDELEECTAANPTDDIELKELLNTFLRAQKEEARNIFIQRYWYMYSVSAIAKSFNCTESKIKMSLKRTRDSLKQYLEREGVRV